MGEKKNTNFFDLSGKTAVVTGAGSGLGKGMALALASAGADVACADINKETAENTRKQIAALGRRSISICVDVSKKTQVDSMVETVVDKWGRLDIGVNSAGIVGTNLKSSELIPELGFRRLMDVMLTGVFLCSQAEAKQMIIQKYGRIINISSISGVVVNPKGVVGLGPYSAIKAGVIHMTKALAFDWSRYNITVNTISPGFMKTPATEKVFSIPERYDSYLDTVPLGRMGEPQDLAGAVVFLASDASSYVTGHNLIVDGGRTIW